MNMFFSLLFSTLYPLKMNEYSIINSRMLLNIELIRVKMSEDANVNAIN